MPETSTPVAAGTHATSHHAMTPPYPVRARAPRSTLRRREKFDELDKPVTLRGEPFSMPRIRPGSHADSVQILSSIPHCSHARKYFGPSLRIRTTLPRCPSAPHAEQIVGIDVFVPQFKHFQ
jgi:hypothetical protein